MSSKANTTSTDSPSKWTRIDRNFPLPAYIREALARLDDAGHIAYIVGGSVRDFLLGRESKDHDIATSATPDELCEIFPNALTVGKAFGVIKIPINAQIQLEIATFREDLEYRDHRHPEGVRFAGPDEDARRRDFTINALFFDPKTSRILDPTGGLEDLQKRVVRAIGDPSERFREDALRLLRAARFTTTLDFELDAATAEAAKARARLIIAVSGERTRDELTRMWTGPHPDQALELLSRLGLLKIVLPEVEALRTVSPELFAQTRKALGHLARQLPARSYAVAWAAVLHDIGKPAAWRKSLGKNFNAHETEGARLTEAIGTRLHFSRSDLDRTAALVADHVKLRDVFKMREATVQRLIREPHFEELLALHRAEATASDGNLAHYEFCWSRFQTFRQSSLLEDAKLLDGKDLIQLGLEPGPGFSDILAAVEDLRLERKLRNKEEALEYVVKTFVR